MPEFPSVDPDGRVDIYLSNTDGSTQRINIIIPVEQIELWNSSEDYRRQTIDATYGANTYDTVIAGLNNPTPWVGLGALDFNVKYQEINTPFAGQASPEAQQYWQNALAEFDPAREASEVPSNIYVLEFPDFRQGYTYQTWHGEMATSIARAPEDLKMDTTTNVTFVLSEDGGRNSGVLTLENLAPFADAQGPVTFSLSYNYENQTFFSYSADSYNQRNAIISGLDAIDAIVVHSGGNSLYYTANSGTPMDDYQGTLVIGGSTTVPGIYPNNIIPALDSSSRSMGRVDFVEQTGIPTASGEIMGGSSAATPNAAVIIDEFRARYPNIPEEVIISALIATADPINTPYGNQYPNAAGFIFDPNISGYGAIDIKDAQTLLDAWNQNIDFSQYSTEHQFSQLVSPQPDSDQVPLTYQGANGNEHTTSGHWYTLPAPQAVIQVTDENGNLVPQYADSTSVINPEFVNLTFQVSGLSETAQDGVDIFLQSPDGTIYQLKSYADGLIDHSQGLETGSFSTHGFYGESSVSVQGDGSWHVFVSGDAQIDHLTLDVQGPPKDQDPLSLLPPEQVGIASAPFVDLPYVSPFEIFKKMDTIPNGATINIADYIETMGDYAASQGNNELAQQLYDLSKGYFSHMINGEGESTPASEQAWNNAASILNQFNIAQNGQTVDFNGVSIFPQNTEFLAVGTFMVQQREDLEHVYTWLKDNGYAQEAQEVKEFAAEMVNYTRNGTPPNTEVVNNFVSLMQTTHYENAQTYTDFANNIILPVSSNEAALALPDTPSGFQVSTADLSTVVIPAVPYGNDAQNVTTR